MSAEWTEDQREAIENIAEGLAVLAAAGSGKTMVLVQRYLRLIASGLTPKQILTVTFTREAAEQLRSRLLFLIADQPELAEAIQSTPFIGTIHSFCLHLLRQHGPERFHPKEILDDVRWHECFEHVFEKWFTQLDSDTLKAGLSLWNPQDLESVAKEVLRNPSSVDGLTNPQDADSPAECWWITTLPSLLQLWDQEILAFGLFSFADLERQALLLLRENTAAREALRQSLGAFLIDEFQDTSPAQWEILAQVIGEKWNQAFIVGDPRQSIYGFRNADVRLFFTAQDRIESFGGKTVQLSTCFRSTPPVVNSINQLTRRLFEDSAYACPDMISGRTKEKEDSAGLSRLLFACGEKKSAEISKAEIHRVVTYLSERIRTGAQAEDFALLFRNSDRISDYASALTEAGIPSRFRKGERVFDQYFSWDILAFFRSLADPLNDFHLSGWMVSPFVGKTWKELAEWKQGTKTPWFETKAFQKDPQTAWFYRLIDAGETSPSAALETLFAHSRYWPARYPCWDSLARIVSTAPDIASAVAKLELCARNDVLGTALEPNHTESSVSLLTVHAAKGLEFQEILLVDLLRKSSRPYPWLLTHPELGMGVRYRDQGEIVSSERYKAIYTERTARESAEEKRLIYVALTRARDHITLVLPEDSALYRGECWANHFRE